MIFYAKTNPIETIREHTDNVLDELSNLRETYKNDIDCIVSRFMDSNYFWAMLNLCSEYHDYGKSNLQFQNKLRNRLYESTEDVEEKEKYKPISCNDYEEIPHNYLSPAFIPKSKIKEIPKELRTIIFQAIAYHHERSTEPDSNYIKEYIMNELSNRLSEMNAHMNSNVDSMFTKYATKIEKQNRIREYDESYKFYIMLKGLLHRLDHSASAHVQVEEKCDKGVGETTKDFFLDNNWDFREPQRFALENKEENLLIIASTGIGKTETALLWIDDKKAFFTLPLRVSLNALYKRVKDDIGYKSIGLLHSTALDYMERQGYEDAYKSFEEASLLSKKLSFSTIDQIFKYPFKYLGYEKVLATLSYSKVVIDEIQAYSPEIAAVILYAIKQLNDMGGKFMIMTATLPRIYKDKLAEFGIKFKEQTFISDKDRHKIKLIDEEIIDSVKKTALLGKDNKVLVIVNTVDKAIEYYEALKNTDADLNVNLLHSLFNNNDRSKKEQKIKEFTDCNNNEKGIWVTTQIVEASLDVDFDYLITEMSTLDSQFQRYGRCFRKRVFNGEEANIYIYTKNVSGVGGVYDKEIFDKSIELLKPYDNEILKEKDKVNLVDKLYSKDMLKGTDFLKTFIKTCDFLENVIPYEYNNKQAQKVLRDIDSVRVIPNELYNENIELFEDIKSEDKDKRRKAYRDINNITISLPRQKIRKYEKLNKELQVTQLEAIDSIYLINSKYTKEKGLCLKELYDNIF